MDFLADFLGALQDGIVQASDWTSGRAWGAYAAVIVACYFGARTTRLTYRGAKIALKFVRGGYVAISPPVKALLDQMQTADGWSVATDSLDELVLLHSKCGRLYHHKAALGHGSIVWWIGEMGARQVPLRYGEQGRVRSAMYALRQKIKAKEHEKTLAKCREALGLDGPPTLV
jgi:hypothetical protein